MMAEEILRTLMKRGVNVTVEGSTLVLQPKSLVPQYLVDEVASHKNELMALVERPPQWHAEEIERKVKQEGIALFWSDVVQDMIAFVQSEELLAKVPAGIVSFTIQELEHLFPEVGNPPTENGIRLIYAMKRDGAKIINSEPLEEE